MIILNNYKGKGFIVNQDRFGDKTLKLQELSFLNESSLEITWAYDEDSELFTLQCLVNSFRECHPNGVINLILPYIPNARQDRKVDERVFTLKYFCKIINDLCFNSVIVSDPHSNVSTALLDRVFVDRDIQDTLYQTIDSDTIVMFPDNGAFKKYTEQGYKPKNAIVGNKHRKPDGRIDKYELLNFEEGTKRVAIIDDICSYGGTFVSASKALREKGVEHVDFYITHCEYNIFKGEVFDYADNVYTTDSILDLDHYDTSDIPREKLDKLHVINIFRKGE